jgi:polysaccharide export outer membrane protein
MKNFHPFFRKELLFVSILLIFLAGCVSQKKIKYLQQEPKKDSVLLWQLKKAAEYRVQANDNLYISIKSLSEKANEIFNQQMGATEMTSDASIYLNSYTVSRDGNISFPVIGNVFVLDMTIEQIKEKLQELVSDYLKETIVIVKLVNFNLTILGEVQKPGEYKVYQDKITIFEGIAMAGDLTDFANRNQIALIRQTEKGSEVHYIDLTSVSMLSSPYYYLKPNDVIYAAPLKVKQWGFATFPYAVIFSAISTLILIITLFYTF